ncbi:hypothetical protein Ddc_18552 [Ditylenchus destructor]|nr:hypothetical protein Ddc_18552 [Ditylenchus destructor]
MHKHNPKLWECKELEGFLRRIESEGTSTATPEPATATTAATTEPSHASNRNFIPALIIWVGIGSNYSE